MNREILSLGDAIKHFLISCNLQDETDIRKVIDSWENLMGKPIAAHTEKLWFSNGIFFIQINSPVWKNELSMAKLKIKSLLNDKIGREIVKEVRLC